MSKLEVGIVLAPQNRGIIFSTILLGMVAAGIFLSHAKGLYEIEREKANSEIKTANLIFEARVKSEVHVINLILSHVQDHLTSNLNPNFEQLLKEGLFKEKELLGLQRLNASGECVQASRDFECGTVSFQFDPKESSFELFKIFKSQSNLIFAKKIQSESGVSQGFLLAALPQSFFSKAIAKIQVSEQMKVSLYSLRDETVILRFPDQGSDFVGNVRSDSFATKIKEAYNDEGMKIETANVAGVEKLYSFKIMKDLNLVSSVEIPSNEIKQSWIRRMQTVVFIYLVSAIGYLMLLYRYLWGQAELEFQRMQLIQSSKMSALGEMAGGVAHEINNPLTIIKGRSEQLERMLARQDFDKDKALNLVAGIQKTTARIANIVKGLRTFSRSGELDPMARAFVADIVNASLELCQEKFKHNNVELRVAEIPWVATLCRETQLSQVVLNLLGNAFDAVEGKENAWVELSFKEYHKNIEIIVTDSGLGISPEIETKIMQPFFTTKAVGKGTGLGLSISKGIVESHNGKFFLNRNSEHTQFVVSLPKLDANQSGSSESGNKSSPA